MCDWLAEVSEAGQTFLDIGCGFGWIEEFAVDRSLDLKITSIEPSAEDLRIFRMNPKFAGVTILERSGLDTGLEDDSIDICITTEVLEHIPENSEIEFFREIHRVLRPGGRALITTPSANLFAKVTDPAWLPLKHRHYSMKQLCRFADVAGLEVTQLRQRGGLWDLASLYDLYFSKWILRRRSVFESQTSKRVDREWLDGARHPFMTMWLEVRKPPAH